MNKLENFEEKLNNQKDIDKTNEHVRKNMCI